MGELFSNISGYNINGYHPFGFLNLLLGTISGIAFACGAYQYIDGNEETGILALIIGIVFFIVLLYRNRQIKNFPFAIGVTLVSALLGLVLFIGFVVVVSVKSAFDFANDTNSNVGSAYNANLGNTPQNSNQEYGFSKQDDVNAQMLGYANAQQYQDLTGYDGHDINPDDEYLRAK